MTILKKQLNLILLLLVLSLLGFYIYQTVSISSKKVSLVNFKKEFLEGKNNLSAAASGRKNYNNFEPAFIKDNFKMAEIEKFDYIIVGPSDFALIENNSNAGRP